MNADLSTPCRSYRSVSVLALHTYVIALTASSMRDVSSCPVGLIPRWVYVSGVVNAGTSPMSGRDYGDTPVARRARRSSGGNHLHRAPAPLTSRTSLDRASLRDFHQGHHAPEIAIATVHHLASGISLQCVFDIQRWVASDAPQSYRQAPHRLHANSLWSRHAGASGLNNHI